MKGCERGPDGRMLKAVIAPERAQAIVDAWNAGVPKGQMKKMFSLGEKRIVEITRAAGCHPRGLAWKPPPEHRCAYHKPKPKRDKPGFKPGIPIKRVLAQKDPDYTDPDAKALMRRFCPVHRLCIVDPKAPPDVWVIGRRQVSEAEMRRLAREAA